MSDARVPSNDGRLDKGLEQPERDFAELIDTLDSIVWEGDVETFQFSFVSKQAERLLGYPVEQWTGDPSFWQDHIHPEDREWAPDFCARAASEMRPHEFEYRMIAQDGRVVWLRDIVTVVVESGKPVKLRGVMVDITRQKQAEERLKQKEEQYRAVFETTSDGLAIADLDANVVEVNPAWCTMHGYTREEMLKLSPIAYVHPDSLPLLAQYYEKVRAGERFSCQAVDIRKDGTPFHVEVHEAPFMYNGELHTLAVLRDITERVQARELLERRVEERTRELETLLAVSESVASTLELEPLLRRILEQLNLVAGYSRASITVMGEADAEEAQDAQDAEDAENITMAAWGSPTDEPLPGDLAIGIEELGPVGRRMDQGEAVIIGDVHSDHPDAQMVRRATLEALDALSPEKAGPLRAAFEREHSMLLTPLLRKDRIIGGLILRHNQPAYYTERHARLALSIGNQAVMAIENARLLSREHDKARLEERQRLARELHDSVTQALFSIGLTVRSTEVLMQREGVDSAPIVERLADLRQLTQGALAEMRALIFELRPGALEEEGLLEALRKHAAAVGGREGIQVEVICEDANALPRLKPAAEEAVYRICQEALHNVVKHARATRVEICLGAGEQQLWLTIKDNGTGFDEALVPVGHMGLGTMRQRTEALGGRYLLQSTLAEGTTITLSVPLEE